MRALVVDRGTGPAYQGVKIRAVTIADNCPECGGPRGEPKHYRFCEDGEWYDCHRWENPCGHIDYYNAVLQEAHTLATQISGYWLDNVAVTDPPQPDICPYCATGPCVAMCEPPADERVYLAAWRDGDFDDDLVGYAEALWHVGYERLLGGAE